MIPATNIAAICLSFSKSLTVASMGNCCKSEAALQDQTDREIQRDLHQKRRFECTVVKLLLIGPKGCGKNTIMKQLRSIHGGIYDKGNYKDRIHQYVIQIIKALINAPQHKNHLSIQVQSGLELLRSQFDLEIEKPKLSKASAGAIYNLCKENYFDSQLLKSPHSHFIEEIQRITQDEYMPTDQDIVLLKEEENNGMKECRFTEVHRIYSRNLNYDDSNWRKYIHCFELFTAWIFVADLSCYEMEMDKDDKDCLIYGYIEDIDGVDVENIPIDLISLVFMFCDLSDNGAKMKQQLTLYESFINDPWTDDIGQIIFLNKMDLFNHKVQIKELSQCSAWSDYDPNDGYYVERDYFLDLFLKCNHNQKRQIYCHFTCATDRNNVERVVNDVKWIVTPSQHGYGLI